MGKPDSISRAVVEYIAQEKTREVKQMIAIMDKHSVVHFIPMIHKNYRHHIKLFTDIFNGTAALKCQKCGEFIPLEELIPESIKDVDDLPP
jgi:hypothetical protein